ncbi:DUF2637 domain-containing protein [Agrococcus casei]|uniref:DUF2637 domain-containing protein n=1 Tax=Agrococcus casei TaxID=343512 RepID=UPI003F926929
MTTASTPGPTRGRRWLIVTAVALVLALTLLAFSLSYSVLQDLAARSGIPANVTWAWPLIVDGTIVVTMVVIFAQRGRGRRANALPWTALIVFALVSVVGNGIHTAAVHDSTQGISMAIAIGVGAVPPVALLVASEMLVRLLAPQGPSSEDTAGANAPLAPGRIVEPVFVAEPHLDPVPGEEDTGPLAGDLAPTPVPDSEPVLEPVSEVGPAQEPTPEAGFDVVSATEPTAEPVPEAEAIAEDSLPTSEPVAEPLPQLRAVEKPQEPAERIPTEKGEQIDWVIEQVAGGRDATREWIAERLGVSVRTAQRRLAEAREQSPEAFAA